MPTLAALRTAAAEQAEVLESQFIGTEHLFLAWLIHARGPIADAISAAGLTPDAFREVLAKKRKGRSRGRPPTGAEGDLSSHARRVIDLATEQAGAAGREEPSTEDLILAMIHQPRGAIARALTEFEIKPSRLKALATGRPTARQSRPAKREQQEPPQQKPARKSAQKSNQGRTQQDDSKATSESRSSRSGNDSRQRSDRATSTTPEATPTRAGESGPGSLPDGPATEAQRSALPLDIDSGRRFSWLSILYLAIPVAVWLHLTHMAPLWVLTASCLAVLPLAGLMGTATEQLAERTGPTVGGLLNATFGNAAELIIGIAALNAGLVDLVKASITGSILGNLLLILGLSLVAGGTRSHLLRFNRTTAGMSAAMLALAVAGLTFPTLFHATHPAEVLPVELHLSELVAVILLLTYLFSLYFVLKTHRPLFGGGRNTDGDHHGSWSVGRAVVLLALATIGVAVMSEILVHAVEPVSQSFGVSQVFLGLIIIPIIGNAAEHGTAVLAARRGNTDLALQIALGSSTQIALLVAPILIFVGALLAVPGMNLVFRPFEVVGLAIAVVTAAMITLDGESHWFEGVQLLALYAMVAVAVWFL